MVNDAGYMRSEELKQTKKDFEDTMEEVFRRRVRIRLEDGL